MCNKDINWLIFVLIRVIYNCIKISVLESGWVLFIYLLIDLFIYLCLQRLCD